MDDQPGPCALEFGNFRLEPTGRIIVTTAGRHLAIPPKAFDAALHLSRAGQVCRKSN